MEEDQFVELHDQDQKVMLGGKRCRRLRLSSPTDSIAGTSGGEEDFSSTWSRTTSGEGEDSTEEEEDLANCLILLAQGDGLKETGKSVPRFDEMARTAIAKGSFYGYECKTCNRAFPSFQALGGHRASHKKLKLSPTSIVPIGEKVKKLSSFTYPDETEDAKFNMKTIPNKGKLHECSMCGLEFSSGQALGGHMRRHRAQTATVSDEAKQTKRPNILLLDLNLPAPEDDLRDTMFQFPATQQPLVFPSPALVDCYY